MKEKISDIINRIRNAANAEPAYRVSDPFKAPAAVTVLPETGGIFCTAGRDAVEIGKSIAENCDWEVYHVASPSSPPVKLDPSMWKILTQYPSVPCVCMVDILANVDGKPYRTVRPISYTNTADGELDEPVKFVTNPMLPGAYIGQDYKAYVGVKLGSAYTGVEWSIIAAPDGFRLEPATTVSGIHRTAIIGTPSEDMEGSDVKITIAAAATGGVGEDAPTVTMECFLVVLPPVTPRIITHDLGVWEVGSYRTVELMVSVMPGMTDIAWSVTPPLPAGLTLDSVTGVISGTPEPMNDAYTSLHTFSVTAFGKTSTKPLEVTVYPALEITTSEYLPDLVIGTEYETTLKVRGAVGTGSPVWQLYAPIPLLIHLTKDGKLYTVRGEPAPAFGTHKIRVGVTDGIGRGATKVLSLECVHATHFVTRNIPSGVSGVDYQATIHTTGSSGVTISSGALPTGLVFVSSPTSSTGTITGTPSFPGTYEFTLRIDLDDGPVDRTFTLVIHDPPTIREEASLPSAMVGVPYQHRISATGSPDMTFASTSPGVPSGMTIDRVTGLIEGEPMDSGAYQVGMSVSNAYGEDIATPTILIRDPVVITSESPLDPAYTNVSYEYQIAADGDREGDKWEVDVLPDGLEINEDTGLIFGTPTAESTVSREYIVTATVTTPEGATRSKTFSMALNPPDPSTPSLLPKPEKLAAARIDDHYREVFRVENAPSGDVTYEIGRPEGTSEEFELPPGLFFDPATGSLHGVPESNPIPDFKFRVTAMQGSSPICSEDYVLEIRPARAYPETLPNARLGDDYYFDPSPTYADPTDTWTAEGLPPGLVIDPDTGVISGVCIRTYPMIPCNSVDSFVGTHTVTITVTTITGQDYSFTRTMRSGRGLHLFPPYVSMDCFKGGAHRADPTFTETLFVLTLDGDDFDGKIVLDENTPLPAGLEYNEDTSTISGTPTYTIGGEGGRTRMTERYYIRFWFKDGDTVLGDGILAMTTIADWLDFDPDIVLCPIDTTILKGVWYTAGLVLDRRIPLTRVSWEATPSDTNIDIRIQKLSEYTAGLSFEWNPDDEYTSVTATVTVTASYYTGDNVPHSCSVDFHITGCTDTGGVAIRQQELPTVYEGLEYEAQLTAVTDGVAAEDCEWTLDESYPLPDGLTLDPSTGKIAGMVTGRVAGPYHEIIPLMVTVTTATSAWMQDVLLPIGGDYDGELRFREASLPAPIAGQPYCAMITLLGAVQSDACTWVVTGLPSGMTYTVEDEHRVCRITGDAVDDTGATSFTVTVKVVDGPDSGITKTYPLSWVPLVTWNATIPTFYVGGTYDCPVATGISESMAVTSYTLPPGADTVVETGTIKLVGTVDGAANGTMHVCVESFAGVITERTYAYTCVNNPITWVLTDMTVYAGQPVDDAIARGFASLSGPTVRCPDPLPDGLAMSIVDDYLKLTGEASTLQSRQSYTVQIFDGIRMVLEKVISIEVLEQ